MKIKKNKRQENKRREGREAAEQWEYHNAIKGICCKAFLFLPSLWGIRLWEKWKERKDKEVLLDYFQSQKSVTEKALAPQAVSSLAAHQRQSRLGARLRTRNTAARGHLPPTPRETGRWDLAKTPKDTRSFLSNCPWLILALLPSFPSPIY